MRGNWITNHTAEPFYARKEFEIDKKVKNAKAYVCGLGQFVFYVNGKKVSDHELDPGWTNYEKLIEYVTFDVTDYLRQGRNALGAEVGNGWFLKTDENYTFTFPAFMPPNPNPYKAFGKYLVLALKLIVEYEDGSQRVLTSDETFKVKKHPVIMSNVYGSETVDGALAQHGWSESGFDDSAWEQAFVVTKEETPKGKMIEQFQPAIRVIKTYDANFLHMFGKREIYDFTQNMSGILQMQVKGKKGGVVKIYPAEKLTKDGDVDQAAKGWVTVDSCITYIIGQDDCWETFRMKFTYFAGRYIAVEKSSADIEIQNLQAEAITSAWKKDGTFTCDDKRYEQIYDIVEKSVEANMMSVHTDCPTIERFAWQEPNHLMAPAIMYMKDGRKLWEKFLLDMRTEQHTKDDYFFDYEGKKFYPGDGLMPSQCPCYIPNVLPVPGMGSFYDIIPWGSTCILGTRWHYIFYGDKKIIEENYEAGKRYLNYLKGKITKEGFINHGLGDWGNPDHELARENVETAFLYADAKTMAWFAEILENESDAEYFRDFSEQIRKNYNEKLLVQDPKGRWCYRSYEHQDAFILTQTCEALPVYWGMVPEEKLGDVIDVFRETLMEKQAFSAGEIGLPYIIQTARQYGMNDLISDFITREEHPSYYAFVKEGLTTLGEYWEENPRSHCHDMMGHIVEWYYNGIAGILPLEPGFRKILIKPYLPKSMNQMTCRYESVNGSICVSMERKNGEIHLDVQIPENVSAKIDKSYLL
ncbi:MAG: family 78 glycoside hydrolase catalytic domain [Eubacteriales bacterium]|nr:family 78 glycoside hydrolase catalytic domain [Eubacteriales bacterium]